MKLNATELQRIQGYLRNVAEVDPDDVLANRASATTVELETVALPFDPGTLREDQREIIEYAISKRSVYVLPPGARHAVNLAAGVNLNS